MNEPLHMALIRAHTLHMQKSRQEFQKIGLSDGQPKILTHLLSNNGILQKDLSESCGVRPATMTSLLKIMAVKNLITKKEVLTSCGKRGNLIFLTDYGRDLAYKVIEIFEQVERICYQGFDDAEKEMLITMLDRVSENLQA